MADEVTEPEQTVVVTRVAVNDYEFAIGDFKRNYSRKTDEPEERFIDGMLVTFVGLYKKTKTDELQIGQNKVFFV